MQFICFLIAVMMTVVSAQAEDITSMISQYRRSHGLSAVKTDAKLTAVAQRQAQAMAQSGIMDHDVAGPFANRVAGANVVSGAENIAAGTRTWADTLRIWKESPGHNKNLLRPDADLLGVAVARNESTRMKVYWAMVIGRRDAKPKPGMVAAAPAAAVARGGRGIDAPPDAPAAGETSVSEWVNNTISSIKSLLH
jgi:hypothetical protein